MGCVRCGRCCNTAFISLHTITDETKQDIMDEGRWLFYHRCDTLIWRKNGKDIAGIRIPLTCVQLEFGPTGYYCKIYDKRPLVCKKYTCENFTDEEREEVNKQWQLPVLVGSDAPSQAPPIQP